VELIGARQTAMSFGDGRRARQAETVSIAPRPQPLPDRLSADERAAHAAFVATLGEDSVWSRYGDFLDSPDNVHEKAAPQRDAA
jgi:DNA polymerase-3 subunit epsilon